LCLRVLFSATFARGLPNRRQNEAKTMKQPAMTLREVQRILERQDDELQAAYRALTEQTSEPPIALPIQALERLQEACGVRPMPSTTPKPASGIRC
jgi:hypothetical protein